MLKQGVKLEPIRSKRATISNHERNGIAAFIELHIEQGKVLEQMGKDIGIDTTIRGYKRS